MHVRIKFRNHFHTLNVPSRDDKLLTLLHGACEILGVDLSNVQVSLNAKDFMGLEQSDLPLSHFGIVSGDIVYVKSLEYLDDIGNSMELELFTSLDQLHHRFPVQQFSAIALYTLPLYLCAIQKQLQPIGSPHEGLEACPIMRIPLAYASVPGLNIYLTTYTTGNMISFSISCGNIGLAHQMMLPVRDHLLVTHLSNQEPLPKLNRLFKHMRQLCVRIKDELFEPALIHIHTACNLPERIALINLPPELLTQILLFLPLNALGKLMLCNHAFARMLKELSPIWRFQLNRINAKSQSLLEAALIRRNQFVTSGSGPGVTQKSNQTGGVQSGTPVTDVESEPDGSENKTQDYDLFVARYRSLMGQRRRRIPHFL